MPQQWQWAARTWFNWGWIPYLVEPYKLRRPRQELLTNERRQAFGESGEPGEIADGVHHRNIFQKLRKPFFPEIGLVEEIEGLGEDVVGNLQGGGKKRSLASRTWDGSTTAGDIKLTTSVVKARKAVPSGSVSPDFLNPSIRLHSFSTAL